MSILPIAAAGLLFAAPQEVLHREEIGRFECPRPASLGDRGRDALARDLIGDLPRRPDRNRLVAVARLFFDHGFTTDQAVNQLVGAYCPIVARDPALNTFEKTGEVQAFADRAYDAVSSVAPVPDPNRW
jgi:hypothetical protein